MIVCMCVVSIYNSVNFRYLGTRLAQYNLQSGGSEVICGIIAWKEGEPGNKASNVLATSTYLTFIVSKQLTVTIIIITHIQLCILGWV